MLTVRSLVVWFVAAGLCALAVGRTLQAQSRLPSDAPHALRQFDTDLSRATIDLAELRPGGPPKDGIPSIDQPSFVSLHTARDWLDPKEPVIAVHHNGIARAYPLQILTHHEIVDDRVAGTPIMVTFCPLCYSAITFKRVVDGEPVTFGVSGLLRKSDLVMYDRTSETLWQQFTGKAIAGTHAGKMLEILPSQIVSFQQFANNYPDGTVLSRQTGFSRPYGRNPYVGYDDVDESPFAYDGPTQDRLPPKEKVVAVRLGESLRAYPHSITREKHVIHDDVNDRPLVVFHAPGAVSALDDARISESKEIGSTGVFDRRVRNDTLRFKYVENGRFKDHSTGSVWTVTGKAIQGPLKGTELERISHGDYFAFAWFAFRPETAVYSTDGPS